MKNKDIRAEAGVKRATTVTPAGGRHRSAELIVQSRVRSIFRGLKSAGWDDTVMAAAVWLSVFLASCDRSAREDHRQM